LVSHVSSQRIDIVLSLYDINFQHVVKETTDDVIFTTQLYNKNVDFFSQRTILFVAESYSGNLFASYLDIITFKNSTNRYMHLYFV